METDGLLRLTGQSASTLSQNKESQHSRQPLRKKVGCLVMGSRGIPLGGWGSAVWGPEDCRNRLGGPQACSKAVGRLLLRLLGTPVTTGCQGKTENEVGTRGLDLAWGRRGKEERAPAGSRKEELVLLGSFGRQLGLVEAVA